MRIRLAVLVLTLLVTLPRFADSTPDSARYLDLAGHFAGTVERTDLRTPYAYRVSLHYWREYRITRPLLLSVLVGVAQDDGYKNGLQ